MLAQCRRILRNEDDAADAVHEVFLRAIEFLPATMADGEVRSWLLTVARNHCIDVLRRRKRADKALASFGRQRSIDAADPETTALDRHVVAAIFEQLSDRERTVLWQTAVEDRSLAEVAGRLHLNYMAAGQVASRARRHASILAAKVAAILIVLRTLVRRHGIIPARLVAAAVLPIAVLTVQPSSSPTPTPPAQATSQSSGISIKAPYPGATSASAKPDSRSASGPARGFAAPSAPLISGAADFATSTLNHVLATLPTATPVPVPTLSPILPTPAPLPLPSLPPLPTPPPPK